MVDHSPNIVNVLRRKQKGIRVHGQTGTSFDSSTLHEAGTLGAGGRRVQTMEN